MVAKSHANGHTTEFIDGKWTETPDTCAKCDRSTKPVFVYICADQSHTGQGRWDHVKIDSCIAELVQSLSDGGVIMRASCCGHGKKPGYILLKDGYKLKLMGENDD